jgi:prepilin-type N-terminal cleavage/methylation domain-containing protein
MRHSVIDTRGRTQAGFSLVEIMLALAIMAVGLIAIIGLIPQGVKSSRDAADNTLAATIAHDILNSIRSQPFGSVNLGDGSGPHPLSTFTGPLILNFDSSGNPTPANAIDYYKVTFTFKPLSGLPPPNGLPLSLVTAIVQWPGRSSSPNTSIFATQIANYQN